MKSLLSIWTLCIYSEGYNLESYATNPSSGNKMQAVAAEQQLPDFGQKNFGVANQANGLLPTGLACQNPTPLTQERLFGGAERIVNGTEAGINWPFIVRLKIDGLFQLW